MKNIIIFHGTGSSPDSYWHPFLKRELGSKGYEVQVPQLPDTDSPTLEVQLAFTLNNCQFDEDTILVGHSSGVPLILSVLERLNTRIKQAVLVAGFATPINPPEPEPMLQDSYDWEKIKANCEKFVIINSDNDPWGCDDKQGRYMAEKLGGQFILRPGEGHMGSGKFNQPYKEFPLLVEVILSKS